MAIKKIITTDLFNKYISEQVKPYVDTKVEQYGVANIKDGEYEGAPVVGALVQKSPAEDVATWTVTNPNSSFHGQTVTAGATGYYTFSFNGVSLAEGRRATAGGTKTIAHGNYSYAGGNQAVAEADNSFSYGVQTASLGVASFSQGYLTKASGTAAHSQGTKTEATGENAFASGQETKATALNAASFGLKTEANGINSIAGGNESKVYAPNSIAVGENLIIQPYEGAEGVVDSAAFGLGNIARKSYAFTTGAYNVINHKYASALGLGLLTQNEAQTVVGSFNDPTAATLFTVGNGYRIDGQEEPIRQNAFEVLADGTFRIPNFDDQGTKIGYKRIKCVNGVLTVID